VTRSNARRFAHFCFWIFDVFSQALKKTINHHSVAWVLNGPGRNPRGRGLFSRNGPDKDVSRGIAFFSLYPTFLSLFRAQFALNLNPIQTSFAMLPSAFVLASQKNNTMKPVLVEFRATVRLKNGVFRSYLVFCF
jgi:hypothetical protein